MFTIRYEKNGIICKQQNDNKNIFHVVSTKKMNNHSLHLIDIAKNTELSTLIFKLSSFVITKFNIQKENNVERCKLEIMHEFLKEFNEKILIDLDVVTTVNSPTECELNAKTFSNNNKNNMSDTIVHIKKLNITINVAQNNELKIRLIYNVNVDNINELILEAIQELFICMVFSLRQYAVDYSNKHNI